MNNETIINGLKYEQELLKNRALVSRCWIMPRLAILLMNGSDSFRFSSFEPTIWYVKNKEWANGMFHEVDHVK